MIEDGCAEVVLLLLNRDGFMLAQSHHIGGVAQMVRATDS